MVLDVLGIQTARGMSSLCKFTAQTTIITSAGLTIGELDNLMTDISATKDKDTAGDAIPPKCAVIEVHVGELRQLFDAIDPSPFRERDLDSKAEEFIVGWAKDLPKDAQ